MEKIKHNTVYVWKAGTNDIGEEGVVVWDMPIVPVKDTSAITGENDLSIYTEYLKQWQPTKGVDLGIEQLIKMKLPKKLQKEILKKPIRLTKKIDEQTQRLVA